MKTVTRRTVLSSLAGAAALALFALGAPLAHASKDKPEIGFCIDDLRVERWSRDRDYFVAAARARHPVVETGEFGADMQVSLVNDGPVTFWLQVRP